MAYDERCYDLAAIFLQDEPGLFTEKHNDALAQLIQTTIEDYIRYERADYEPPEPDGEAFRGGEAAAFERDRAADARRLK